MKSSTKILPSVLIVIVNWNGKEDLLECLASLNKLDYDRGKYKVLVVDNGSSDMSREVVETGFPEVMIIGNMENKGYVKAANQGIEYGLDSGVDYIWIFNNDVIVEEDTLINLVEAGEKDKSIGVVAPVIYSYSSPEIVSNSGYKINMWTGGLRKLKYGEDVFSDSNIDIEDVDSILGCSNLIRSAVFKKIGLLKTVYELYFEETDFNVRSRMNGFRVVIVKGAKVWHKEASTMNKFIFRRAWLLLRNLFIFEILNARLKHLAVFIPYYFLIHLPYFLIRGSIYGLGAKLTGLKSER